MEELKALQFCCNFVGILVVDDDATSFAELDDITGGQGVDKEDVIFVQVLLVHAQSSELLVSKAGAFLATN